MDIHRAFKAFPLAKVCMKRELAMILAALTLPIVPLKADPPNEQGKAREQHRAGNVQSLREIERKILPQMRGMQYLGPEYDPAAMAYRLKFIDKGKVHFVDVDARTGRIIGRTH